MSSPYPATTKVMEISKAGGPQTLQPATRALAPLSSGEVLIEVHAAGVNRPDVMQRQGLYPPPPGASDIPGLEVAGRVVAVASDVATIAVGDSVCALVTGGGYAEYCVAPEATCLPVPAGFSMTEAGGVPETFFTVWTNVFERGRLLKGEYLLVHGGSSGIGTTAIQLGKAFGSAVIVTAGTQEKCRFCESLGAEHAINYREADFVERVRSLTRERGVDVILDMVGGDYFPRNLKCLAAEGRLVQIALQRGPKAEMNLLPIMLNRLTVTGSTLRPRSIAEKSLIRDALRSHVWPLLEAAKVRPVIHQTFALTAAGDAHAVMESSKHIGKLVLLTGRS